jgi:hypothetical protein
MFFRRSQLILSSLYLASTLLGCGGPSFAAGSVLEHDAGDVPEAGEVDDAGALVDVVHEAAEQLGDAEREADPKANRDGQPEEQSSDEAGHEASVPCTPPSLPLAAPSVCEADYGPPIDAPGRVWLVQSEATPYACWSYPVAGSAACEACTETYTCACIAPLLVGSTWSKGLTGRGCVDSPEGPYFLQ